MTCFLFDGGGYFWAETAALGFAVGLLAGVVLTMATHPTPKEPTAGGNRPS